MEPEHILLLELLVGLTLYAVFGGADFGGGIWEVNTAFLASRKERKLIHQAMGPVWEANHVWLIFVIVLMLNAFPPAFAAISRALFCPLFLGLLGIVCRGAAFAFRSHAVGDNRQQEIWQIVFALASVAAPFFLGGAIGALASGKLEITSDGHFQGNYYTDWINPLSIFTAFFSVGMCSYLAAFFLVRESAINSDEEMTTLWRQRALSIGIWMGILATVGIVMIKMEAPHLWQGFINRAWPLLLLSFSAGMLSLIFMGKRWYFSSVVGAASTVATVLVGYGLAQYPLIFPPVISIDAAKSPDNVLWLMIYVTFAGAVLLLPSLFLLFSIFKSEIHQQQQY